uniref:Uncharacterized protein n=1 Tax=Acrobeloides nanus TaxID=290746 RepID=A0A914CAX6_9BILA
MMKRRSANQMMDSTQWQEAFRLGKRFPAIENEVFHKVEINKMAIFHQDLDLECLGKNQPVQVIVKQVNRRKNYFALKQELRKALAKKCLIQSQELDEDEPSSSHSGSPENFEQGAYLIRMKSTSLDEEDWKRRVEGAQMLGLRTAPDPKVGAIQRMRNKLCKWKLAIADTRS